MFNAYRHIINLDTDINGDEMRGVFTYRNKSLEAAIANVSEAIVHAYAVRLILEKVDS